MSAIQPLLTGETETIRVVTIHQRQNGTTYPVEINLQLSEYGGKKVFATIILDITQRKQAEQALKESEEKFRYIAENISDGILTFGADFKINYVSPAYIKQIGYGLDEELGRNAYSIYLMIHPDDSQELYAKIYKAIELKKSYLIYTYRVKNKADQYIWREDHAQFVYDSSDNYKGSYVICRDITERVQIE